MGLDFSGFSINAEKLGQQLLDGLTGNLLKDLTDPDQIEMASRASVTIAGHSLMAIGASEEIIAQLQEDYDSAWAVLLTLASADIEDGTAAAASVRTNLNVFIREFLVEASRIGITALIAAV